MKNKASLVLMELLVMVLIFALAAAACLRCFLWAAETSRETARQDRAVVLAQNAAEAIKATGGDFSAARQLLDIPEGLSLQMTEISSGVPGLGEAEILVKGHGGAVLFSLDIAWQEDQNA